MKTLTCKECGGTFELSDADTIYYEKIAVPQPKLCPKDRLKRRLCFRNERSLYKRKCDKTGKDIISHFRVEALIPVYNYDEWHKDDWNPPIFTSYDFKKSFFEQFQNLMRVSPHVHKALAGNDINSPYINHAGNCKNCYFIFNSEYDEDSMYLRFGDHCRDCVDCTNILDSELCYECVNVEKGYRLFFSDDCKGCRDSVFLRYCRGVSNSIFCYGLEQKQYHVLNQPYTKEEFIKKLQELKLHTYSGLQNALQTWNEWSKQFPLRRQIILNCENCTGDSLYNSKNSFDCYNCTGLEDCRYVLNCAKAKDSYDIYAYGEAELCYEFVTTWRVYNCKFCSYCANSDNMEYCDYCWGCHYCFGCSGLKGKSFCVFNKQYSKEDYEALVIKIKEKMMADGEYGEFFPAAMSYFPYEDSLAQDYFPQKDKSTQAPQGPYEDVTNMPEDSANIDPETFSQKAFLCPETNKLFRFQKKELEFYKKMSLPLPRVSFEARYEERNQLVPFPY